MRAETDVTDDIAVPADSRGARDESRRAELADFLRSRRAAVTPDQVGLRASGRRRTPGLRREEVAELADVGLSWYTWLEQGRDIAPSVQVLDAIARALLLTSGQRDHLLALALPAAGIAAGPVRDTAPVDEPTASMVTHLAPHPAYLLDERFDVVAHNAPAELIMPDLLTADPVDRNLLVWLFAGRRTWVAEDIAGRWEQTARANLLDFRTVYGTRPADPRFHELLQRLTSTGEPFTSWWAEHDVAPLEPTDKIFPHPELGELRMRLLESRPVHATSLRLRVLVPTDERTRTLLRERYGR